MASQIPHFDIAMLLKILEAQKNEITETDLSSATVIVSDPVPPAAQVKPSKFCGCEGCKKKLALTDFSCKCGVRFCSTHRLPEEHKCSFDFRSNGQAQLKEALVKVDGKKLDRI